MGRDIRLSKAEIRTVVPKMMKLNDELFQNAIKYYNEDGTPIPDSEFDAMVKELKELEEKFPGVILINSYSRQVGIPLDYDHKGTNVAIMGKVVANETDN